MRARLIEHGVSILLVTLAFVVLGTIVRHTEASRTIAHAKMVEPYLQLDFIDFGNPLHRALFKETLDIFNPDRVSGNDSLLQAIERFRQEQFSSQGAKTGGEERGLNGAKLVLLAPMYARFVIIYLIVMVLSYHATQSLAILQFVRMKQGRVSHFRGLIEQITRPGSQLLGFKFYFNALTTLVKALAKGIAYALLFTPAYVIAYSIKSGFDTSSFLFMIVLGVISNGLLITYANKFLTFLVAESRKGYVETAIVKNLSASYTLGKPEGIPYVALFRPTRLLPSHIFRHIYVNARFQYLPSLKEHASFLITGLIIIEMALNIQGQLGYEMLQNILYKQYDVAMAIVVGIFLVVKSTEIIVDTWFHRESMKYENREKNV